VSDIAKPKRGRNWKKPKLPGVSWTIKEKLDLAIALIMDNRFSHAEKLVGLTLIIYFHNTQTGDLH
jgi:hypothetical protein